MLDIRKNYLGHFPEFDEKSRTIGTKVFPVPEEGKPLRQRPVTVLESDEVKKRHAEVRAELGLDEHLRPIKPSRSENIQLDNIAGDPNYYREFLGSQNLGWEEL